MPGASASGSGSVSASWLALGAVLLLLALNATASEPVGPPAPCTSGSGAPPEAGCSSSGPADETWADSSYRYVTGQGDALAQWIDSFFGVPANDAESADSVLRLLGEYKYDEESGNEQKLRLRGKVDLPRLSQRLSLVFSEDDDERRDVSPDLQRQDSDVGLQYRLSERDRSRLYLSIGANSSLEFRSSLRYRYNLPIAERWNLRLSERLYYKEGDGFGTLSRADLDYAFDADHIVRWTSDVDYGEETDGSEWGSRISYFERLNAREAVSTFAAVSGQTDPESWVGAYALGLRYRRNVFRPWMFVEFEPSRVWRKPEPWENRSSAWVLTWRIEVREEVGNRRVNRPATSDPD